MSMALSFSVKRSTPLARFLIIVLAPIAILTPIAYLTWWGYLGGEEWEIRRGIERLVEQDPVEQARAAVAAKDYRLYNTGGVLERVLPGVGFAHEAYRDTFGYRGCNTFVSETLTAEQSELNRLAMQYMEAYNRTIVDAYERNFPKWRAEYDKRMGSHRGG